MTPTDAAPAPFRFFNEIAIIEHLSRTAFERVLPDGLSVAGFGVLNHFVRLGKDGESPSRLARAFQVEKSAMTFTLSRLEALGAVTVSPDPADGRGKIVRLTRRGRALRETAIRRLEPLFADLARAIDLAALEAALPLLSKVRAHLDRARD